MQHCYKLIVKLWSLSPNTAYFCMLYNTKKLTCTFFCNYFANLRTKPLVVKCVQVYSIFELVFIQMRWDSTILVLIHTLLIAKLKVLLPGTKPCSVWW